MNKDVLLPEKYKMKHIFLLTILAVMPFSLYSAPQFTPLDGYKGGPRIEQQKQNEKIESPKSKMCKADLNTQSSTELHLMVLDSHISENYLLNNFTNCMWV